MLNKADVIDTAKYLVAVRDGEREELDRIHAYWRGKQKLPIVPNGVPREVRELLAMSRVNLVKVAINVLGQGLAVSGYRSSDSVNDDPAWDIWQANKLDARQSGIYRSALAYGVSYVTVLPGDPHCVITGVSPRRMTALYGADPDWPEYALQTMHNGRFRLFDAEMVWELTHEKAADGSMSLVADDGAPHGMGVTPVVRYRNQEDLDDEDGTVLGEVHDLMPLQDQMDATTFGLLVAQHFQAFRQRYILGWTADDEASTAKAAASRLWTFEDPDVKVGEFGQLDMTGYLSSRESTGHLLATIGQIPVHELTGKLINLSAEALAAAEAGKDRKTAERETTFGESAEQTLELAARREGLESDPAAQVVWRDSSARSFAATVDALGKIAQMLNVPQEMLWERIPGFTQQDVARAKAIQAEGGGVNALLAELANGQVSPVPVPV